MDLKKRISKRKKKQKLVSRVKGYLPLGALSELLKRGRTTVARGPSWRLEAKVDPSRKVQGKRDREAFGGVFFKKRF